MTMTPTSPSCYPQFIDAHCHLSNIRDTAHVEHLLEAWAQHGLESFILGGFDRADWERQDRLCALWPDRIHACWGLHPWAVARLSESACANELSALRRRLDSGRRPVALGELGLDTPVGKKHGTQEQQRRMFHQQLVLARDYDLPVVLHVVRAHGHVLAALQNAALRPRGGLIHGFMGDKSLVTQYARLGFLLSLGPSANLMKPDALRAIPAELLVVESDASFNAPLSRHEPVSHHREQDEHHIASQSPGHCRHDCKSTPLSILTTAEYIARVREQTRNDILRQSRRNLERIFSLKEDGTIA